MNSLVTGGHGFSGPHLRRLLREGGWTVSTIGSVPRRAEPGETYFEADLLSRTRLREALAAADPDVVFHLAARNGRGGEDEARRTLAVNVEGTAHLLEALVERGRPARVIFVGTSAQYGKGPSSSEPVTEDMPLWPLGVYGWSKLAAESVAFAHHGRGKLEVLSARPFNHIGPGEPEHLVCSAFAKRIAAIEAGAEPVLAAGNLDTVRDFTDVRDLVKGFVALAERGTPGRAYNLCSGRGRRVREILAMLLDRTRAGIEVRADPAKARAGELERQVGSYARAEAEVGWHPEITLAQSLDDLLAEWRDKLGSPRAKGMSS
jgi:GDP-4-dehydro-6-deoxy-D-mannose reductase